MRPHKPLAIAFALLATAVRAQPDLAHAARNPYDSRFIDSHRDFDWMPMWNSLGVEPRFIQPCGRLSDGRSLCSTELITVLDPDQVILQIIGDITPADIYLRFLKQRDGGWKFAGAHEAYLHNHPRRHEMVRNSGTPFLLISSQGLRGSDVDSEIESIFDLTRPGFDPVLTYIVTGHQQRLDPGISRRIQGTLVFETSGQSSVIYEVEFYAIGPKSWHLGSLTMDAQYVNVNGKFTLQTATSSYRRTKIVRSEAEALLDLEAGPSSENLVRYGLRGLKDLAAGQDTEAHDWLRRFLVGLRDTSEVQELKSLLH